MKIETEIPDINRDEVIEAMARQLLTKWTDDPDPGEPSRSPRSMKLGLAMRNYLDEKIGKLAETLVREEFGTVIKDRIAATVDAVLEQGWAVTDGFGNARGPRVDLKGRISEALAEKQSEGHGRPSRTLVERLVLTQIEQVISSALRTEVEAARKALRAQLGEAVAGKFAETIKTALGIR